MSIKNVLDGGSFRTRHIHKCRNVHQVKIVEVKTTVWVDRPGRGYAERQRAKRAGLRLAA